MHSWGVGGLGPGLYPEVGRVATDIAVVVVILGVVAVVQRVDVVIGLLVLQRFAREELDGMRDNALLDPLAKLVVEREALLALSSVVYIVVAAVITAAVVRLIGYSRRID